MAKDRGFSAALRSRALEVLGEYKDILEDVGFTTQSISSDVPIKRVEDKRAGKEFGFNFQIPKQTKGTGLRLEGQWELYVRYDPEAGADPLRVFLMDHHAHMAWGSSTPVEIETEESLLYGAHEAIADAYGM